MLSGTISVFLAVTELNARVATPYHVSLRLLYYKSARTAIDSNLTSFAFGKCSQAASRQCVGEAPEARRERVPVATTRRSTMRTAHTCCSDDGTVQKEPFCRSSQWRRTISYLASEE